MKKLILFLLVFFSFTCFAKPKIYISFQWHMHQPIYWPGENILETQSNNRYSFSLFDVHNHRYGPYTSWPYNAIKMAADADLPHAGAQVSFSGSLIENLNNLEHAGVGFNNWRKHYTQGRKLKTVLGHSRLDLIGFGYHHPLMPLISYQDIRDQISTHREIIQRTFGYAPHSRGLFPPENAFADWMIPALVDEGIEWVLVDNIHFNRTVKEYPWVKGERIKPPNIADQRNPKIDNWFRVHGVWAPGFFSGWAEQPHWVVYRDPKTGKIAKTPEGKIAKMIAVPTERYLGNEDGRGGFGALNYDFVMSQFEEQNTDPDHPILFVLHHDGDNFGGGTLSYYNSNFYRFIEWLKENPDRFEFTTVQDYLDRFPPAEDDVIYVEPGSWSGADNGDPEFNKWNGAIDENGYSYDRNSWAVMTAAQNIFEQVRANYHLDRATLEEAKRFRMVSQTSCYEYWDGTEDWDSHPTRASNKLVDLLRPYLNNVVDNTPPSIFFPTRVPYNPGGYEWTTNLESSDFEVRTMAFDYNGISKIVLRYRVQEGKEYPKTDFDFNTTVGEWNVVEMEGTLLGSITVPLPYFKAHEFKAQIKGITKSLVSYQIVAIDNFGNRSESTLNHVYVGNKMSEIQKPYLPLNPTKDDVITFTSNLPGTLHWGVNGWNEPAEIYWPIDSTPWGDGKALRSQFQSLEDGSGYFIEIGPFNNEEFEVIEINATINYENGTWLGKDYKIKIYL